MPRAVPARLRPTAPIAADAILVGDPGRSLLLAQELLEEPRMSNHARGLWGYSGRTPAGRELTIQATGMGGPSAAMVLTDLAKLGVERVVRVGTCVGLGPETKLGEVLLAGEAIACGGSAAAFDLSPGAPVTPDPELHDRLAAELEGEARVVKAASFDSMPVDASAAPPSTTAADMQTVAVLARARELGIAAAALLIVSESGGERIADEKLESAARRAGQATAKALSQPQVKG
jgi:uridine phosphorylase